ncbi:MAG: hypothetical protein E7333_05795 [Clostridiales bacterium]|nr:hypothetical protein [Clostridiales bacterium]
MVTSGQDFACVLSALSALRLPLQQGEYDLHQKVMAALDGAGIPYQHEYPLAPRCRIDLICGREKNIGVEIKRGKVDTQRLRKQLERYAACPEVSALIVVTEKTVPLPDTLLGKPLGRICLNRLWGIAL